MHTGNIERLLMPNAYVKHLGQEVLHLESLTAGTGIAPEELEHYDKPVTVAQSVGMMRNALSVSESSDWHLQWGQHIGEHFHGPVSMASLNAPTFGDGFDAFLKYIPSRVPYHHWQGYREGSSFVAEVVELMDFGNIRQVVLEVPILVMYKFASILGPGNMADARIELTYPAPMSPASYARWFHCPITFGARRNALVFPDAWRDAPNLGYDEVMWNTARIRCDATCCSEEERDTLTLVRQALQGEMAGLDGAASTPSLETLAQRLHCSSRTLIRRLRVMNTTYSEIVDQLKKQRACEFLGNENLRIHEIASALGYRDSGAFVRAFKRFVGVTPGQFREQRSR